MSESLITQLAAQVTAKIDEIEARIAPDVAELAELRAARERLTGSPSPARRAGTNGSRRGGKTNADRVLDALRASPTPMRASEIAEAAGVANTHALLNGLMERGEVVKDTATRTYTAT